MRIGDRQTVQNMAGFFLKLNLFALPMYAMIFANIEIPFLQAITKNVVFSMLSWMGMTPAADGYLLSIPTATGSWGAFIDWDCTAWKSMMALCALVLATPRSRKEQIFGIALLPALFAINIIRIVFMFGYARTEMAGFAVVHEVLWSWGMIAVVLLLWLAWLKYSKRLSLIRVRIV